MDFDMKQRIIRDIAGGVSTTDSKLQYGRRMIEFREKCEREFAEHLKKHPGAVLDIPLGIEGMAD